VISVETIFSFNALAPRVHFRADVFVAEVGMFAREPIVLKITRVDDTSDSIPTLRLEGKLLGPWVDELRRVCEELHSSPGGLRLNLAGVMYIDPAGIKLLCDLIGRGATVSECTGFVDELLRSHPPGG
jgi:ABC-type transporter Mla MlaB component